MKTFKRYKTNLKVEFPYVISYGTKVAVIKDNKLEKLKWNVKGKTSSPTTTKHINYVAHELDLTILER